MTRETILNTGETPRELSADAGYYSARAVGQVEALRVDLYIAPEKTRHGTKPEPAPRGRIPKGLSARERMRRKLRTKRGRERYALRMETVEPVFGQIKQGRGFRQFLLRGLEKVNREWLLICAGHNLLKLFRFGARRPGSAPSSGSNHRSPRLSVGQFSRKLPEFTNPRSPTLLVSSYSSDRLLAADRACRAIAR